MLKVKEKILTIKRIENGWNKTDLARMAKVNHSVIARAEQGKGVSPNVAKRIADCFNETVLNIFEIQ
jgi:DNA-binding XRE family transcriptional regulator